MKQFVGAILLSLHAGVGFAQEGDPAAGETKFNICKACHSVGEGAANRVGPHLNGVVGRIPGSLENYTYSAAMKEYGTGHVWDAETLSAYLAAPRKVVPGTKMAFAGVRDPKQIADIIAYLGRFQASGVIAP